MLCSLAWTALMRRNLIYRKRNWISTLLEVALPVVFLSFLVLIKNAVDGDDLAATEVPAYVPQNFDAFKPLSFDDYVVALQAQRVCSEFFNPVAGETDYLVSGIFPVLSPDQAGNNWMVPLIKCDASLCEEDGVTALPYCEYSTIAVAGDNAGGQQRAKDFTAWLVDQYPALLELTFLDYPIVQEFGSSQEMDDYVQHREYGELPGRPKIAMGIVFDGDDVNQYRYSLRQNSTNYNAPEEAGRPATLTTPDTSTHVNNFARTEQGSCEPLGGTPDQGPFQSSCTGQYLYNGVLTFQRLVGDYIHNRTGVTAAGSGVARSGVVFVPFPERPYLERGFFGDIQEAGPLLIVLGLLYPVASMISYMVKEKELRQKELMKMMSVTESDIGWSWFLTFGSLHLITVICMTAVSTVLYSNSDTVLLFIFWLFTWLTIILFSMVMAALTSKTTRGVLIGLLLFFIGVFVAISVDYADFGAAAVLGLHPVVGFSFGLQEIGNLEDKGIGLTSVSAEETDNESGYTIATTIRIFIVDCLLWGFLAFYLNRVIRPDYGQAQPWYFPFKCCCPCVCGDKDADEEALNADEDHDDAVPFEPVGEALHKQSELNQNISIKKLRKTFGEKTAVDGLSVNLYAGQITALLGHNGAGKSTTISMLSGSLEPSQGTASILGRDIRTDMGDIRKDIGICLQHDCLFPDLTVREHVQFFARIKGLYTKKSKEEAEDDIDQSIKDVALFEKRNTFSKNLSGGMKRKLSVAIAFSGGSKVVILDEPTSGMDPFSRRFTWNVIRNYKQDRIILLTTHFMDEADVLGDRIAIMAEGQLRCCGSSLFLKKTYGVGYQLTIEKLSESDGTASDKLKQIVRDAVPEASLLSNVGTEMSFQLPMAAASKFGPMFDGLDAELDENHIITYGVSITTLDEVFLLVARGDTPDETQRLASAQMISSSDDVAKPTVEDNTASKSSRSQMDLSKENLFLTHLIALFKKRAANFRRDKKAWCCTTVLPSLFVLIGFLIFTFASLDRELDPLLLTLEPLNKRGIGAPVNPVAVNVGGLFSCQPGFCAYDDELLELSLNESTRENYFFCGTNSDVNEGGGLAFCSVDTAQDYLLMETISGDGVNDIQPQGVEVTRVNETSTSLLKSSDAFASSQMGAVFFGHDIGSVIEGSGLLHNETAIALCEANPGDYSSVEDCLRFNGLGYLIQYNFTGLHTAPLFQSLADEAIVRHAMSSEDFKIQCTIAPLPPTRIELNYGEAEDAFPPWFLVLLSFPFIAGSFATFIVVERESKAKHLQTVAGVKPSAYWISSFIWDTANYQIPMWITVILMFAFDVNVLTTTERDVRSGVIMVLWLFGPAAASYSYCLSYAFTSPSLINLFIIISGFLIGMGGPLAIFILYIIGNDYANPKPNLVDAANIIKWILRIFFPQFCLGQGLYTSINIEFYEFIEGESLSAWSEPILLMDVVFLAIQSVGYLCLAVILDYTSTNPRAVNIWRKMTCRCTRGNSEDVDITTALPDDDDVVAEQNRIKDGNAKEDLVVISDITKIYDNGKKAVNSVSLGIPPGQCFGLLGINGAGKTTLMGMLTAEFPPTSGDATLAGYSIVGEPDKIRRRIGYCPQFDAHFANMTGREHIELYAAVKGIPKELIAEAVADKLTQVGLSDADADRLSSEYSGGMKRRLSLACAMIGNPQIVFLDECSTGVDPMARREIWQMVSDMVSGVNLTPDERPVVVLTTHSMEECEALCPRIGIMANGRLRCLGSAQHLKDKFGQGYQVELKAKLVNKEDEDYTQAMAVLAERKGGLEDEEALSTAEDVFFNLEETQAALQALSGDNFLVDMLSEEDANGYVIFKNASSGMQPLDELAVFCATELRMRMIAQFVENHFKDSVLRERQDTKARYEVSSEGLRISSVFSLIEGSKEDLRLADYGVSQTSLEQVFNMHAAEAEALKQGRNDG